MKYLIRHNTLDEPNGKAHLINGDDTFCKLWSNPGTNKRKNWKISGDPKDRDICSTCASQVKDFNPPDRPLSDVPREST